MFSGFVNYKGRPIFNHSYLMRCTSSHQSGFTLVELVVVVILIAIVAATVVEQLDQPEMLGADDQLLSALRYAQKVALASRHTVYVAGVNNADGSSSLYLCWVIAATASATPCASGEAVPAFGGGQSSSDGFVENLPIGVTFEKGVVLDPLFWSGTGGAGFNSSGCFGSGVATGASLAYCTVSSGGYSSTFKIQLLSNAPAGNANASNNSTFNPILIDSVTGYARFQN